MLRELHIAGLGVIDDLDLALHPGLNVLTGETGAGKTMVTVGLSLILGQRGSSTLVRSGARAAKVGARFVGGLPASADEWVEDPDEGLVLSRTVGADGKGSARICGQLATVSALGTLGPDLVEVHGQHETQRLLQAGPQAEFLDRFAGHEHRATLEVFRERLRASATLRARIDELTAMDRDREREIDLLAYQVREIESAGVQPDELEALETEESRSANAERLAELAANASESLGGQSDDEGGAGDGLRGAASALEQAAALDPTVRPLAERAASLMAEAEELSREVREQGEALQIDPAALEELRARVQLLRGLRRKYGEDEAAVLAFVEQAKVRLAGLEGSDDECRDLEGQLAEVQQQLAELAGRVSAGRREAAPRLAAALEREIHDLGMQGGVIDIRLEPLDEATRTGPERVEILLAGGPGQRSLPLAKAASGGELSRVMLACRSVLADLDAVATLVFDEVDTGIGGQAGVAVGRRLARIAQARQVVVVTHLPQIAAFADLHLHVEKSDGTAGVMVLDPDARVRELSRMLSGLPESDSAAIHAEELLAEAGRERETVR
ncbi:MAG: DNA repair protein RecN [Actinomycetota bacterium]